MPSTASMPQRQQLQTNAITVRLAPVLLLVVGLITIVSLRSNSFDIQSLVTIYESNDALTTDDIDDEVAERQLDRELEQEKPEFVLRQQIEQEKNALQQKYLAVQEDNNRLKESLKKADEALQNEKGKQPKDGVLPQESTNSDKGEVEKLQQDLEQVRAEKERAETNTVNAEKYSKEQMNRAKNLEEELEATKKELDELKKAETKAVKTIGDSEAPQKPGVEDSITPVDVVPNIPEGPILDADGNIVVQPLPFGDTCPDLAWPTPPEGTPTDLEKIWDVTKPYCNETTGAVFTKLFYAGYRNQVMAFTGLVFWSIKDGHNQILLDSLMHKDLHGTNRRVPHEELFDVAHWNSYYPALPRMVHCDPAIMIDATCSVDPTKSQLNPPIHDMPHHYKTYKNEHFNTYMRYTRKKGPLAKPFPNPADVLIRGGALRPHPDMRAHAKNLFDTMNVKEDNYMALHARIEPDMQKHPVCRDAKVLNLTSIVEFLETEWKDPPVDAIFMPINRFLLEKEGLVENYKEGDEINWIAVNNLKEFDRISNEGLWGGRVKIFTFGSKALNGTKYAETMWSIGGSILDFDIATNAKIFVGTEISSFSADLVSNRFYRSKFENYYYRPDGLHKMTNDASKEPPAFNC